MDVPSRPLGPVAEASRRLRGVQRAISRLSSLDSVARLVSAAPREACRAVGFERAMLSHIRRDGDPSSVDEALLGLAADAEPSAPAMPKRIGTLTARESDVLQLMAEGASNASIGKALVISQATVKSHVRHILRKLGATNRTEA